MIVVPLGEVAAVRSGFAFKSSDWRDIGVPVIKIANVKEGSVVIEGCSFVSEETAFTARAFQLTRGDILISMTGYIGQVAKVRNEGRLLLNQRVGKFTIRDPERLDSEYLFQWLKLPEVRASLEAHAHGAAQPNISPTAIEQQPIPLPILSTQRRIAAILSDYDDLIENNTRRIAILGEMAQRIYEEWFVRFHFPGYEAVQMVESELGLVPEGWLISAFDDIASFTNGYAFKPEDLSDEGLPIVKIKELKAGVQRDTPRYTDTLAEKYRIKHGDLLFSWSADLDVYIWADGDGWLNQHLFLVYPTEPAFPNSYLFHSLKAAMPSFRSRSNGATMKHIKRSALSEVKAVVPSADVLAAFDRVVQPMHDLVMLLSRKNVNLRATRDHLLPKLISGELDVSILPEPEDAAA